MPLEDIHGNRLSLPPEPAVDAPSIQAVPDGAEFPEGAVAPLPCVTAFIVYMLPDGRWQISDDLDVPLVPERKPHGDDFTAGCATVSRDVATQELISMFAQTLGPGIVQGTAQAVLNGQMQLGKAMQEKMQNDKLAEQLEAERKRRGGR